MSKGGSAPYRKGAEYERYVQAAYERSGWLVTRQPKSQSPYDLICVKHVEGLEGTYNDQPYHRIHLVQCKVRKKISKKERLELVTMAKRFSASPLLATGKPIETYHLTGEGMLRQIVVLEEDATDD